MKRNLKLLLLLIVYPGWLFAQTVAPTLSPAAQVSLLTLSPGEELYSTFGHSAIRVMDPMNGLTRYTITALLTSGSRVLRKVCAGQIRLPAVYGSIHPYVLGGTAAEPQPDRAGSALPVVQKQRLFAFLEWNALPENRNYRYDFFYDNCSTRIRDALKRTCGDSLQFHLKLDKTYTFRQLLDIYLLTSIGADFGMDIGQGMPSDRIATPYQAMFLPDFLMGGFESATLLQTGKPVQLVSQTMTLFEASPVPVQSTVLRPVLITPAISGVGHYFFRPEKEKKDSRSGCFPIRLYRSVRSFAVVFVGLVPTTQSLKKTTGTWYGHFRDIAYF